ncbi:hypothetical protein B0H12DRAFT_1326584 [Mycena haematopus]|nr:hypothetical protein B0H12DRAFT_1326584 [Mycena haematopus]
MIHLDGSINGVTSCGCHWVFLPPLQFSAAELQLCFHESAWGLTPSEVPRFVVFTVDDAVKSLPCFFATRDNHAPWQIDEINGSLIALNALAGILLKSIIGFRAPFFAFSIDTLKLLAAAGFTYDSSALAVIPATDAGTDAFWAFWPTRSSIG